MDVYVLAATGYYGSVYVSEIYPHTPKPKTRRVHCNPTTYPASVGPSECCHVNGPEWSAQLDVLTPHGQVVLRSIATKKVLELRDAGFEVNDLGHWESIHNDIYLDHFLPREIEEV